MHYTELEREDLKQFRLVVDSACAGSACSDAMNFAVFDPKLSKKASPIFCDIACAANLVRSNVLRQIGLNYPKKTIVLFKDIYVSFIQPLDRDHFARLSKLRYVCF